MMKRRPGCGFTLIELLVSVSIVALLLGLLLPALGSARQTARTTACLSNQRQLVLGWMLYADAHGERAMPLAEELSGGPTGGAGMIYWWGQVRPGASGVEVLHEHGFLTAYLESPPHARSVYECPSQPWGSYRAQPAGSPHPGLPTSTYGYNGYYLSPVRTPGWSAQIGNQPWKRLPDLALPSELFVFADTLLPASPPMLPMNNALLDPPMLFASGAWTLNPSPTTAFRHGSTRRPAVASARADGSASLSVAAPEWLTHAEQRIGSVGIVNDPHYIPDWTRWR